MNVFGEPNMTRSKYGITGIANLWEIAVLRVEYLKPLTMVP